MRPRPAPTLLRRFGKSGGVPLACSISEVASISGTRRSSMVRVAASCNCLTLRFKAFSEHDRRSHRQGPFPAPGLFLDRMCAGPVRSCGRRSDDSAVENEPEGEGYIEPTF